MARTTLTPDAAWLPNPQPLAWAGLFGDTVMGVPILTVLTIGSTLYDAS